MAIVADKSGNGPVTGNDYTSEKANRNNAGTPSGSLTPLFSGELVYDTTNGVMYRGTNTAANTSWEKVKRNG